MKTDVQRANLLKPYIYIWHLRWTCKWVNCWPNPCKKFATWVSCMHKQRSSSLFDENWECSTITYNSLIFRVRRPMYWKILNNVMRRFNMTSFPITADTGYEFIRRSTRSVLSIANTWGKYIINAWDFSHSCLGNRLNILLGFFFINSNDVNWVARGIF